MVAPNRSHPVWGTSFTKMSRNTREESRTLPSQVSDSKRSSRQRLNRRSLSALAAMNTDAIARVEQFHSRKVGRVWTIRKVWCKQFSRTISNAWPFNRKTIPLSNRTITPTTSQLRLLMQGCLRPKPTMVPPHSLINKLACAGDAPTACHWMQRKW